MSPTKRLVMFALAAAVAVGCGKNNEDNNSTNNGSNNENNSNNANNSNNVNNTNNQNNPTNNATNNPTNNATNNETNNATNNMTNMYTPHDFTCADVVTPAGAIVDLVAAHNITDGCVGVNNFTQLDALCPTGVIVNVENTDWTGRLIVNDANQFIAAIGYSFSAEIFAPEVCTTQLGGGTCDGLATFVDTAIGITQTTCVDDGAPGDCYCTITGPGGLRRIGTIADGANAGEAELSFLQQQGDGSYLAVTETWEFQTDGTTAMLQNTAAANSSSYTGTVDAAGASDCEQYCLGFLALCNENENVDSAYLDTIDCVTQCMGFTPGTAGDTMGDTLACRMYHLGVAADASDTDNPDTHCQHAQATATAPCAN